MMITLCKYTETEAKNVELYYSHNKSWNFDAIWMYFPEISFQVGEKLN